MTPNLQKTTTIALTESNSPLVITSSMSIRKVSILPTSTTGVTITGTGVISGFASEAITLTSDNSPLTIIADEGFILDQITITAPSGATANIALSL